MNAPEQFAPALASVLADLDGPALIAVRDMIDVLLTAGEAIDPEAEVCLIFDSEAVTMTLTVSVPIERTA